MKVILWTTTIIFVNCLILLATRREKATIHGHYKSSYHYSKFFILTFIITLIIAEGFRYGYQDTANYKGLYTSLSLDLNEALKNDAVEKGYVLIEWTLKHISPHPQTIILFLAIVITVIDVLFIKQNSYDVVFSLYLYFLLSFISNMNGIRQILASCLLCLAFPWVRERKLIPYLIWIVLLSFIHKSILVVLPLCFLYSGKRWNSGIVLFLLFCVMSVFFPGPINYLIGRFADADYAGYLEVYKATANILHIFIDGVPLLLGLYYHTKNKDTIGQNRTIDVMINMQAVSFGFMILATSMAQYARICMYMRHSVAITVPFLINQVFKRNDSRIVRYIAILAYFAVFAYEVFIYNRAGYLNELYLDFGILHGA